MSIPKKYRNPDYPLKVIQDKEGYFFFYDPTHPMALSNGTVRLHRHRMAVSMEALVDRRGERQVH